MLRLSIPAARRVAAACLVAATAACSRSAPRTPAGDAAMLHAAVQSVTDVIVHDIFSPPQAARVYAYASVAAYEAMRPGHPERATLAGVLRDLPPLPAAPAGVDWPMAGVHAFLAVATPLTFSQDSVKALKDSMDRAFRAAGVDGATADRTIAWAEAVAKHVLAWSKADGYLATRGAPKFTIKDEPGRWIPTPPAYMDAVEPNWGQIRPFAVDSAGQFRPAPPYAYDLARTSPYMKEVVEAHDVGKSLTPEQRNIAAFWDCNPYVMNVQGHTMFATKKISPGGHWMGIAAIAARKVNADAMTSADAYVHTAVALADGFLTAWDEKYRTARIRPETVINKHLDEQWAPLLQTPPFPEYPSGHSVISGAAATALTKVFGDGFAFIDSSEVKYGLPVRSFTSFQQAADEASISRLYGGIHYRQALEEGLKSGRGVGGAVAARLPGKGTTARADSASRRGAE